MTRADKPIVVLLAEDEALVRMLAADVLTDAGSRVLEVANAKEALAILQAHEDVQALVADVEMPGLDGFTLARLVGQIWPHSGIVVVSGREQPANGDMPQTALFLSKPYRGAALVDNIRAVLAVDPEPAVLGSRTTVRSSAPVMPASFPTEPRSSREGLSGGLAEPLPEPAKD